MENKEIKIKLYDGMKTTVEVINNELVIKTYEKEEKPYPKLMKHKFSNLIVFMTEYREGFEININSNKKGYYATDWNMIAFEDYHGTVEVDTELLQKILSHK